MRLNIVLYEVTTATGVVFCVMSYVKLLSKKRVFVREMEKEMEMCLWAAT